MIKAMVFILITILAMGPARADIELSPLRQVLTNQTRVATFTLSNPSARIIDGRVTWVDLSATQTGYTPADAQTRANLSAAPYLTLTPAQFRLEPGARIEVTVRLKDGARPPPGERRSHLLVETGAARTLIRKASSGLQADIAVGVSVPVLLRGRGRGAAVLSETKLLRDGDGLLLISTAIEPTGAYSTYGRLTATFLPAAANEEPELLGVRDNVAGYPDAPHRLVEIPFGFFSLGAGELTLRYEGGGEYAGRIFDERTFTIAPPK
jgi:P pilus assembly chaperone PapD